MIEPNIKNGQRETCPRWNQLLPRLWRADGYSWLSIEGQGNGSLFFLLDVCQVTLYRMQVEFDQMGEFRLGSGNGSRRVQEASCRS